MKKNFWKRVLSGLTAISLLLNSLLPYSIAGMVYAQESTDPVAQEATISSETPLPTESPTITPPPDSTPAVTADPIPTPDVAATVTPTAEMTPTPSPEITPSNLSPPTPTPTPVSTPDLSANPEDLKSLSERPKVDFPKDLQTQRLNYVPGEVIVKFKREKLDVKSIFGKVQAFVFEKKFSLSKTDEIKTSNIQVFKSKKSTEELVKELKSDPAVEYAEPNYLRFPTTISTNDTYKDSLWGLDNTGQTVNGVVGTNDADIDAPEAWNVSDGSGNIIVAIIDSGVAYNHPDLAVNMWDGSSCKDETGAPLGGCNHGYDFENNDKTPLPDTSSHGTFIAGIIAAAKNNNKGIIGVSPQAKIMALKYDFTIASEVKAIDFAIQNGAKVINASFDGDSYSQSEYDAINRFRTAGGIIVVAAGNGGNDGIGDNNENSHFYPSDYDLDNIISVTATDQNDGLASFSNYGVTSVDVGAPGINIYSTIADLAITYPLNENFDSVVTPNIPTGWSSAPSGFWGTLDLGGTVGKVLYGDYYHYPYLQSVNTTVSTLAYDLAGSSAASIDFITGCDTEYSTTSWSDYMALEISSDNFSTSTELLRWDEAALDWLNGDANPSGSAVYYFQGIPIPSSYFNTNFKIRFRWIADGDGDTGSTGGGCLIDLLTLSKFALGSTEKYDYMDGTSFAAPFVAGLAGLIWSYNPALTSAEVKDAILQTGDSRPSLAGKTVTGKRVNAYNALAFVTSNNPPTTSDVSVSTNEDTSKLITLVGNDSDGDTLTYLIIAGPSNGDLGVISGNQVIYTPSSNYNGADSFTFKANDGTSDSNVSNVSITIDPVNDAPAANDDLFSTAEETPKLISLTALDIDLPAQTLTYSIVTGVGHGILSTLSGNQITYTPE